jgi:FkbH-like protein
MGAALESLKFRLLASLKYNVQHGILTFVSNFATPQQPASPSLGHTGTELDLGHVVGKLNERLAELVAQYQNVYVADFNALSSCMGKRYFQDDLMGFYAHGGHWYPGEQDYDVAPQHNAPAGGRIEPLPSFESLYPSQSGALCEAVYSQWESMYRTVHQIDSVKLVIFDLDDTMWRGQIAEHYGDYGDWPVHFGWPTGLWEAIQHLRARGIMTAICSKNTESLVQKRWDRAAPGSWVTLDDFLFKEINWKPKAVNVGKIIKQAALTPKSVLFIDDNPVERESVRLAHPGIRVLGSNPYVVRRILLWSAETQLARLTRESMGREQMMRQQIEREAQRESLSREEFLQQLRCKVQLHRIASVEHAHYPRSFELLNKTNQFNTTGIRWSPAQMTAFLQGGGCIYAFHVEDRYTQYGLTGVILFKDGRFEQFAMSCRVLGLEVETSVIHAIVQREAARHQALTARVLSTDANMVCRDVYVRCGFVAAEPAGEFTRPPQAAGEVAAHLTLTFDEAPAA